MSHIAQLVKLAERAEQLRTDAYELQQALIGVIPAMTMTSYAEAAAHMSYAASSTWNAASVILAAVPASHRPKQPKAPKPLDPNSDEAAQEACDRG